MALRSYTPLRAGVLIGVHVLIALHFAHWHLTGRTLATLEINEVIHTLQTGIVTVGFLFIGLAMATIFIFGRFFCGWGCHVLALQDLSTWALRKVGIQPKPLRSRVLLLVAPCAAIYLFIWPVMQRIWQTGAPPRLRVLGAEDGYASFVTTDMYANLPSLPVGLATFFFCTFAMVYLFGNRAFCNYACAYGALFTAADTVTPGRVVMTGSCDGCMKCTAACGTGVIVHQEIHDHGMVVNRGCLRTMDCVTACPKQALSYTFVTPPTLKRTAPPKRYDFSWREDLAMGALFLVSVLVFRGLYDTVPFFMALGVAAWVAISSVYTARLATASRIKLRNLLLKNRGTVTRTGHVFAAATLGTLLLTGHSGMIRYHEAAGYRAFSAIDDAADPRVNEAMAHYQAAYRFGIVTPASLHRRLSSLYLLRGRPDRAESHLRAALALEPGDLETRLNLAVALRHADRADEAVAELTALTEAPLSAHDPNAGQIQAAAWEQLGHLRAPTDTDAAIAAFRTAIAQAPAPRPSTHEALGALLSSTGQLDEAAAHLTRARTLDPTSVRAHNNAGVVHNQLGQLPEAIAAFEAVLTLDPDNTPALVNLAAILARGGEVARARTLVDRALALDPGDPGALQLQAGLATLELE